MSDQPDQIIGDPSTWSNSNIAWALETIASYMAHMPTQQAIIKEAANRIRVADKLVAKLEETIRLITFIDTLTDDKNQTDEHHDG